MIRACANYEMVGFLILFRSYDYALPGKTLVWIGGAHYSGTSVLAAVISASPEVRAYASE